MSDDVVTRRQALGMTTLAAISAAVVTIPEEAQAQSDTNKKVIEIKNAKEKVTVEVELIKASSMPDSFKNSTNVAKVHVGGQEFYAVVGKTNTL